MNLISVPNEKSSNKTVYFTVTVTLLLLIVASFFFFTDLNDETGTSLNSSSDDEHLETTESEPDFTLIDSSDNTFQEFDETLPDTDYEEVVVYIYEEEVDSADDCTKYEKYDDARSVCYYECETESECLKIEAQIDDELANLGEEYEEFAKNFKEFEGDSDVLESNTETIYSLDTGEKFILTYGAEDSNSLKVKKWFAAISPDEFSDTYVNRLILYENRGDDSAAYVTPSSSSGSSKWDMYLNTDSFSEGDKEVIFTLIHEFAHILTLNNEQVDEKLSEDSCTQYYTQEGCLKENAYLNVFYNKFWKGNYGEQAKSLYENYDKNPSAFVTEYAATNPGEDIAETFATFVFNKKKEDQVTIADKKIGFFYSYSELVEIRNSMRSELKPFVRKRIII